MIDKQVHIQETSTHDIVDLCSKITEKFFHKYAHHDKQLNVDVIETPLGLMLAVADEHYLHLLEFVDGKHVDREIKRLMITSKAFIVPGMTSIIASIKNELALYFAGKLQQFTTPCYIGGSSFQHTVWLELQKTPYGKTRSYLQQAQALQKPTASRAVANANGANQLSIIIPCHRIVTSFGKLGGYAGGVNRKQWLLDHEKRNS